MLITGAEMLIFPSLLKNTYYFFQVKIDIIKNRTYIFGDSEVDFKKREQIFDFNMSSECGAKSMSA